MTTASGRAGRGTRRMWIGLALAFSFSMAGFSPASADRNRSPVLSGRVQVPLVLGGLAGTVFGEAAALSSRPVPPEGFSRAEVVWGFDRSSMRPYSAARADASNWALIAALALPLAAGALGASDPVEGALLRGALLFEAELFCYGLTMTAKRATVRPRPFLFYPEAERPARALEAVRSGEAFRSFPSGHASLSWCAASLAVTDRLRSRPDAAWGEHAAVAFAGAAAASLTARFRVDAGVHFPSDVLAGSLLGIACGTAVPLIHAYSGDGRVEAEDWTAAVTGAAAGTAFSLWVAPALFGLF